MYTFKQFLKDKKSVRLGYLGGSITAGSGASSPEKCWRCRTERELGEMFPDIEFTGIDAAIGGTGSDLGVFRMDEDLMKHNPDFVFVEFAVNDSALQNTDMYMEGIVRKILKKDKNIPIVFVYTLTQKTIEEGYASGKLPMAVAKQQALAEKYGIPSINIGLAIYEEMQKTGNGIEAYTVDTVHPNDTGYDLYTKRIMRELFEILFDIEMPETPVTGRDLSGAGMVLANGFANENWKLSVNKMYKNLPNYIYSNVPGDELEFSFEGSAIGLYFTMEKDSGNFEYSIDGGAPRVWQTWDKYCRDFNRDNSKILDDTLSFGKHTLKIRILKDKEPDSEGTYIRIGAFLVG